MSPNLYIKPNCLACEKILYWLDNYLGRENFNIIDNKILEVYPILVDGSKRIVNPTFSQLKKCCRGGRIYYGTKRR